jgi:hypothetical protein
MSAGMPNRLEPNGRSAHGGAPTAYPVAGNGSMAAPHHQQQPPHATLTGSLPGALSSTYIPSGSAPVMPPPQQQQQQQQQQSFPVEFNRNPLLCLMCNQAFQNPCLLACYHTFCAVCLRGRAVDGKLACPMCG